MTKQQICDFYDANPDLTLAQLASMLRMTVQELKQILQTPAPVPAYGRRRTSNSAYRG